MGARRSVEEIREWTDGIRPLIAEARAAGAATLQEIADTLNARGVAAFHGGSWSSMQVWRVLRQRPDESLTARR